MAQAGEENELDAGFPSGPWSGFYVYARYADFHRQSMDLTFRQGRMTGRGRDDIGDFVISGGYDLATRKTWWTKTYPGSHSVSYSGVQTGRTIQGDWSTQGLRGGFTIWPGGEGALDGEFFVVEQHRLPALVED